MTRKEQIHKELDDIRDKIRIMNEVVKICTAAFDRAVEAGDTAEAKKMCLICECCSRESAELENRACERVREFMKLY